MTAPSVAARYALAALGMGVGLGVIYGFLRPLRPRLTVLADLCFVALAWRLWLEHTFAICGGDSRLAYALAMLLGAALWEGTLGKSLRPIFSGFWRGIGALLGKTRKIFHNFFIFLLARKKK